VIFRIIVPGIRGVSSREKEEDKSTSFRAVYLFSPELKTVLLRAAPTTKWIGEFKNCENFFIKYAPREVLLDCRLDL
jgi:hypothetical protein